MGGEESKSLSPKEVQDLKRQTSFSGRELRDWFQKFHADCPSGQMTHDEFIVMYRQLFPQGDAKAFAEHVFRLYDADGNGVIDFREFVCTIR